MRNKLFRQKKRHTNYSLGMTFHINREAECIPRQSILFHMLHSHIPEAWKSCTDLPNIRSHQAAGTGVTHIFCMHI